jgi:nucleoside-diphosphate-sugar epimerase
MVVRRIVGERTDRGMAQACAPGIVDPRQRCPDITLAKRHLDWSPQVSLEDGINETVAYFRRELGS